MGKETFEWKTEARWNAFVVEEPYGFGSPLSGFFNRRSFDANERRVAGAGLSAVRPSWPSALP